MVDRDDFDYVGLSIIRSIPAKGDPLRSSSRGRATNEAVKLAFIRGQHHIVSAVAGRISANTFVHCALLQQKNVTNSGAFKVAVRNFAACSIINTPTMIIHCAAIVGVEIPPASSKRALKPERWIGGVTVLTGMDGMNVIQAAIVRTAHIHAFCAGVVHPNIFKYALHPKRAIVTGVIPPPAESL